VIRPPPDLLEAPRLPALCRGVCLYAGLPLPPATSSPKRFVVRSGSEPPELLVRLLEEGLGEDEIEVCTDLTAEATGIPATGPARVVVRPGHAAPCPDLEELRQAVAAGDGPVLVFAVEHHDETGRLLGVTWAAVPEEEPPPQGRFRAAVRSYDYDPPPANPLCCVAL
jgi:hypothetical protein